MPSDIVQVIDRALVLMDEAADERQHLAKVYEDRGDATSANALELDATRYRENAAQLRALRDRIVEDRKANAEWKKALASGWDSSNGRPAAFDIALNTERALLAFCREVGT